MTPYLLYQTELAWRQDRQRQERWSLVKSAGEFKQLRAELKKCVLEMIGGLPTERTALHAVITGTVRGNGFHIEKLMYQSIPGFYVTALVYVPDDKTLLHPAVLVAAGHSARGKNYYQDLCERLVLRGYLVISWDPVGQGERSQFWDAKANKSRYNLICAEHAVMGNLAYLAGANLARWEIWDGMRAVDYLLTRTDVDGQRISITGTSGGGFQAALIGALDERIKVVIPSCYITSLPMRMSNRIFADPDSDPEQDLFGFISKGVDHAGLLLMMYPRAVLVATATLDFFPVDGAHKSYSEARAFYERFGHADRIAFTESYNHHQFSLKNQETALNFLDRFNRMTTSSVRGLAPVATFSDEELRVTRSGQVSVDYPGGESVVDLIAKYAAERSRGEHSSIAGMYRADEDPGIAHWTISPYAGSAPPKEVRWEAVGSSASGGVHMDRYILHHSTYLKMPLLHFYSDAIPPKGAAIWLSPDGKATAKDWPQIAQLLGEGYEVFSFDFRASGENRMNYETRSPDDPNIVQGDRDEAYSNPLSSVMACYVYNSLLSGRPYFLQMIDDVEIAELFIRSRHPKPHALEPLTIVATGDAYGVATRVGEIDDRVTILPGKSSFAVDWSKLVGGTEELWPIIFLLPSGALGR